MSSEQSQFLPYGRQTISEADITSVVEVLRSPFLTQGPVVPAFEQAIATKVGARHAVAVNSATSALHIACLALGLGPGDYLWTSPITFVASANCGRYCGAQVDFVDIDAATGLMSVEALSAKLERASQNGTLPKIVVPVHLCGTSCDMQKIAMLADRYGFAVLEDASHAIGGIYKGQMVGNCRYSDITVFSFHPVKIITTGEGGLATTNNSLLAQDMIDLRSHGITKDEDRFQFLPSGPWAYEQQKLGFNYRMSDIHAALGLSQLSRLDQIIESRQILFQYYQHLMLGLPLTLLKVPSQVKSALHLAVIRLGNCSTQTHKNIFEGLRACNIGVQLHYSPVHLQPYYRRQNFKNGDFPESEKYSKSAISIPLYPGLKKSDIERISASVKSVVDDLFVPDSDDL